MNISFFSALAASAVLLLMTQGCGGEQQAPLASKAEKLEVATNSISVSEESSLIAGTEASSSALSGFPVKVYFSKNPSSLSDFTKVFPVNRVSPTVAVATFSIQLIIAGPTESEFGSGFFSELNGMFTGASNCAGALPVGGPDFKLALNKRGSVPEPGTATVRFCRTTQSAGIGADVRVTSEISATLKQFRRIKKVIILSKEGSCFGDESGMDTCLKP